MPNGKLNIVNRNEYKMFKPSPREVYPVKSRITSLQFKKTSHDANFERRIKDGTGFLINNSEIYVNGQKPIDGIFSPLFGADTTQDAPIYSCACHKLTGGANRGRICPNCGQEVRTIEADLRITGYVDIAPYHIMSFHGYNAMSKVYKNLDEIIHTTGRTTKSGKIAPSELPTIQDLYDDYEEKYEKLTGLEKEYAFMSKIPVYSSRLRPLIEHEGNRIAMVEVNKYYLSIVNIANVLATTKFMPMVNREIEVQRNLNQLQQDFNAITKAVVGWTNTKKGIFRQAMASGRLDNSSRLVISLGTDLMAHEVDVPYQLMMVQYEEEIANYVSRLQDIPISKAIDYVQANQTSPNPLFVKIIKQFLKSGMGVWILVNRNPTISESGIQYMRIRKIHDDPTDMTLHLPPDVLVLFGADFDGDQVTTAGVKNRKYHRYFMTMCSTYAFIDRADGRMNKAMSFEKDYAALISAAWDIDTVYDQYLTTYDHTTYTSAAETLAKMGLDDTPTKEILDHRSDIIRQMLLCLEHSDDDNEYIKRYIRQ